MKSSKHVETCFVMANKDFDDKLTAFSMKNNFWTKIPQNGHCGMLKWPLTYVLNIIMHWLMSTETHSIVSFSTRDTSPNDWCIMTLAGLIIEKLQNSRVWLMHFLEQSRRSNPGAKWSDWDTSPLILSAL